LRQSKNTLYRHSEAQPKNLNPHYLLSRHCETAYTELDSGGLKPAAEAQTNYVMPKREALSLSIVVDIRHLANVQ